MQMSAGFTSAETCWRNETGKRVHVDLICSILDTVSHIYYRREKVLRCFSNKPRFYWSCFVDINISYACLRTNALQSSCAHQILTFEVGRWTLLMSYSVSVNFFLVIKYNQIKSAWHFVHLKTNSNKPLPLIMLWLYFLFLSLAADNNASSTSNVNLNRYW